MEAGVHKHLELAEKFLKDLDCAKLQLIEASQKYDEGCSKERDCLRAKQPAIHSPPTQELVARFAAIKIEKLEAIVRGLTDIIVASNPACKAELEGKINQYATDEIPTDQTKADFTDSLPVNHALIQLPFSEHDLETFTPEKPRSASRSPRQEAAAECVDEEGFQPVVAKKDKQLQRFTEKQEKIRQHIAQSLPSAKIRRCAPLPSGSEHTMPSDDDLIQAFNRENEDGLSFFVSEGFSSNPGAHADIN